MTISDVPPRMPSSLSEVNERLQGIEAKIDQVLAAVRTAADETARSHQERLRLVRDVADLMDRVSLLERKVNAA